MLADRRPIPRRPRIAGGSRGLSPVACGHHRAVSGMIAAAEGASVRRAKGGGARLMWRRAARGRGWANREGDGEVAPHGTRATSTRHRDTKALSRPSRVRTTSLWVRTASPLSPPGVGTKCQVTGRNIEPSSNTMLSPPARRHRPPTRQRVAHREESADEQVRQPGVASMRRLPFPPKWNPGRAKGPLRTAEAAKEGREGAAQSSAGPA